MVPWWLSKPHLFQFQVSFHRREGTRKFSSPVCFRSKFSCRWTLSLSPYSSSSSRSCSCSSSALFVKSSGGGSNLVVAAVPIYKSGSGLKMVAKAEDLISFQVYSFAAFLFSSLIALSIKQALKFSRTNGTGAGIVGAIRTFLTGDRNYNNINVLNITMATVNKSMLQFGILLISVGSMCGCLFLMLGLVNLVQVKLGTLTCPTGNGYSIAAIVPLLIFVPATLLINVGLVFYAFTR